MSTVLWCLFVSACWAVFSIFMQQMAYRYGIWDGAFNQFLPKVRREMFFYDAHRAAKILGKADE